jgi:mono/diheme cytochrome c family protein
LTRDEILELAIFVSSFALGKPAAPAPAQIETPVVGLPTPSPNASVSEPPLVGVPGDMAARIRVGSSIFRQFCIVCHGPEGVATVSGDGSVC